MLLLTDLPSDIFTHLNPHKWCKIPEVWPQLADCERRWSAGNWSCHLLHYSRTTSICI